MTRKQKKKLVKNLKDRLKRGLAGTFAVYFLLTSVMVFGPSTTSHALTGGPSQPEVQSFEPIGTSDMVNVFSGDFNYNIPLLDVEGYPINLAYNSGILMDQEASWTGLGWNVNVGTINRGLRGIPDDFNGLYDKITTETNMKPNRTVTLGSGLSGELFGFEALGFSADLGVSYNNYNGVGLSLGGGLNVSMLGGALNAGLGINSSSDNGLSISPNVSLTAKLKESGGKTESLTTSVGTSFNSRGGMKNLSINSSLSSTRNDFFTKLIGKKNGLTRTRGSVGTSYSVGQQTYIPSGGIDMRSFSIAGRFKLGIDLFGADGGISVDASYASQWIKNSSKHKVSPAYGYFNSEKGQLDDNAILDFNREKDGSVSSETPALPVTNFTYDMFSVSGQGVGGSYRGFRSDIGYVSDPKGKSTSSSVDLSAEVSPGNLFHAGANVGVVISNSKSGKWKNANAAKSHLKYNQSKPYSDYEPYYLREANEMSVNSDPNFMAKFGGDKAANFALQKNLLFNTKLTNKLDVLGGSDVTVNSNYRAKRDKRNNIIQTKTIKQVRDGMGMQGASTYPTNSYANAAANGNHIGEIVSLGTDGMRYVYGLPAYNTLQNEVTFAVGQKTNGNSYNHTPDCSTGLITYNSGDNSLNNDWGIDNYFQKKSTPAYSHSFLLTAVVSPDYVDLDNNGPSPKDLGTYTKFHYTRVDNYKWRTPFGPNTASYSAGLNTDPEDDKANYIYGAKELWYLDRIETKNFIALFELEDRQDGYSVNNEDGSINTAKAMKALKKITLYSKPDYDANPATATPLKEVYFEYNYELCPGIPNSINNGGKLTLKKVYFIYRDSKKGKLSPYQFSYSNNYAYNLKGYDRWGNYKQNTTSTSCTPLTPLSSAEYPYVDQFNESLQDQYAAAWALTSIDLPSGGSIGVDLESDDYSFVQNREAMQMLKIIGVGNTSNQFVAQNTNGAPILPVAEGSNLNRRIFFELDPSNTTDINPYIKDIDFLYFRCLMQYTEPNGYDYVPGYAEIKKTSSGLSAGIINASGIGPVGYIDLAAVSIKDPNDPPTHSPIAVAAAQFGRLNLTKYVWNSPSFDDNDQFGASLLEEVYQVFVENFKDGFKNPNQAIFDKGRAINMVVGKSWIRLNNVNDAKMGGGCRVAAIRMNDNWNTMTDGIMTPFDYGQEYEYTETYTDNGVRKTRSSGVASYEPQLGGDENPWKQPYFYNKKNVLAPDNRFYQEEPFGEMFFPSASVGYSYVTVKNLQRGNDLNGNQKIEDNERTIVRHATGEVHHEFYTCKEFPTITKMTKMDHKNDKISPFSILSILNFDTKDYFTASQGFVVELNDMHGKPKSQKVYQEDKNDPITEVEYFYKSEYHSVPTKGIKSPNQVMDNTTKRLTNNVQVVYENGTVSTGEIGVVFDAVADFRESKTTTLMPSLNGNLDVFLIPFFPVPIPISVITVWPSYQQQRTRFRSAGFTKVIQRFGVLERTVAKDLGSTVQTKNLAYDAETGNVLLTQTTTDFNDNIYTMNYPAYWYYENMGPAYRNIGFTKTLSLAAGMATSSDANKFVEGDEVILTSISSGVSLKAWVTSRAGNSIGFQKFDGGAPSGIYTVEVIRSGRRNQQTQNMASITTLSNPLNAFSNNAYQNVIQASAIEFNHKWRTYCDCFEDANGNNISTNPYVLGTKGNFRPLVSYLHLSKRTQSDYNDNTNIRKDGMFQSYSPYYKSSNGDWTVDKKDWTFTAEVTEFNPYGQEVENRDALGRYSAATFGFNQTLAKSVAANAKFREIGFTSFEDDDFSECADNHFKFDQTGLVRDDLNSHSGEYSIKVAPGNDATLTREIAWCNTNGCFVDVQQVTQGNILTLTPTGGNPEYIVDWSLNSGPMPPIAIDPTTSAVELRINKNYTMTITWLDAKGCTVTYKIISTGNRVNAIQIIKLN